MYKKIILGVFGLVFAVMAAGVVVQMTSASIGMDSIAFITAEEGNTIVTRTPQVGETVPTRTPAPGTVPTRTPSPDGGCISFAHFNDIDAGDADILVRVGGLEVAEMKYGEVTDCINVPPGSYLLEIFALSVRSPEDTLISFQTVNISSGAKYTAVMTGDAGNNQDNDITFFIGNSSPPNLGRARVRVVHAAPIDSVSANTLVDLRDNGTGNVVGGVSNLAFGIPSSAFEVDANVEYDWFVAQAGTSNSIININPFTLKSGEEVTVYVTGGGANRTISADIATSFSSTYLPVISRDYTP